jgi:hypothetical protein
MLQPTKGLVTCRVCNASYESESALVAHQQTSHRGAASLKKMSAAAAGGSVSSSGSEPQKQTA